MLTGRDWTPHASTAVAASRRAVGEQSGSANRRFCSWVKKVKESDKLYCRMEECVVPGSICCFCLTAYNDEAMYGKFYKLNDITTHYFCLLLSSKIQQKGSDEQGILGFLPSDILKEIKRGKSVLCTFCQKRGATISCHNSKCKVHFHLPCGRSRDTFHEFFGEFKSFCCKHRIRQKIKSEILKVMSGKQSTCYICLEPVPAKPSPNTLWAPCCSKDAWFHRLCIQRLALSAGYFFKCPLCNNTGKFVQAMRRCGIWIPEQDASWERDPERYEGLLQRHNTCDAELCICTRGREFQMENTKWEIMLCADCGSQGMHVECGNLRKTQSWVCPVCSIVTSQKGNSQNTGKISVTRQALQSRNLARRALPQRTGQRITRRAARLYHPPVEEECPVNRNSETVIPECSLKPLKEALSSPALSTNNSKECKASCPSPTSENRDVEVFDISDHSDDEIQLWRSKKNELPTFIHKQTRRTPSACENNHSFRTDTTNSYRYYDRTRKYIHHGSTKESSDLFSRFISALTKCPVTALEKGQPCLNHHLWVIESYPVGCPFDHTFRRSRAKSAPHERSYHDPRGSGTRGESVTSTPRKVKQGRCLSDTLETQHLKHSPSGSAYRNTQNTPQSDLCTDSSFKESDSTKFCEQLTKRRSKRHRTQSLHKWTRPKRGRKSTFSHQKDATKPTNTDSSVSVNRTISQDGQGHSHSAHYTDQNEMSKSKLSQEKISPNRKQCPRKSNNSPLLECPRQDGVHSTLVEVHADRIDKVEFKKCKSPAKRKRGRPRKNKPEEYDVDMKHSILVSQRDNEKTASTKEKNLLCVKTTHLDIGNGIELSKHSCFQPVVCLGHPIATGRPIRRSSPTAGWREKYLKNRTSRTRARSASVERISSRVRSLHEGRSRRDQFQARNKKEVSKVTNSISPDNMDTCTSISAKSPQKRSVGRTFKNMVNRSPVRTRSRSRELKNKNCKPVRTRSRSRTIKNIVNRSPVRTRSRSRTSALPRELDTETVLQQFQVSDSSFHYYISKDLHLTDLLPNIQTRGRNFEEDRMSDSIVTSSSDEIEEDYEVQSDDQSLYSLASSVSFSHRPRLLSRKLSIEPDLHHSEGSSAGFPSSDSSKTSSEDTTDCECEVDSRDLKDAVKTISVLQPVLVDEIRSQICEDKLICSQDKETSSECSSYSENSSVSSDDYSHKPTDTGIYTSVSDTALYCNETTHASSRETPNRYSEVSTSNRSFQPRIPTDELSQSSPYPSHSSLPLSVSPPVSSLSVPFVDRSEINVYRDLRRRSLPLVSSSFSSHAITKRSLTPPDTSTSSCRSLRSPRSTAAPSYIPRTVKNATSDASIPSSVRSSSPPPIFPKRSGSPTEMECRIKARALTARKFMPMSRIATQQRTMIRQLQEMRDKSSQK